MCNSKKEEIVVNSAAEVKVQPNSQENHTTLVALLVFIIGLLCAIILCNVYRKWKQHIIANAAK